MNDPLNYLDVLLRARLTITEARSIRESRALAVRDGITPTPRLILFRSGRVRYTLEERTLTFAPATLLLVPALARRAWDANGPASATFFAFKADPEPPSPGVMILTGPSVSQLLPAMREVELLTADRSRVGVLAVEAAAKAVLARFLLAARPIAQPRAADRSLTAALQWLGQNLAHADPLAALPDRAGLSAVGLRRRFKLLLGQSPRDYLLGLRMRQARFELTETTLPVKQVARRVGFDDPLYFSRRYQQFWKCRPTDERA